MVNYYELTQHQNQFLKSNFEVMMLDDYNDNDAAHHGRNQRYDSTMALITYEILHVQSLINNFR